VNDALSAGPALLKGGSINVTSNEEVFFGSSIPDVHPRSAAGRTADGALILMIVLPAVLPSARSCRRLLQRAGRLRTVPPTPHTAL